MKITSDYLLMGSAALVFAAAGILYGAHPGQVRSDSGEQTVTTTDGKMIHVKVAGRVYRADVADGTYKLTNGGAIRVRGGKVVWDAFGAVQRRKTGKTRSIPEPIG